MDQYGCTLLYNTIIFAFCDLNAKGRGDKGKGVKCKSSLVVQAIVSPPSTRRTHPPRQALIFPSRPRRDGRRRQARPCRAAAAAFGREGGLHAPHLPLPPRHQRLHRRWERKPRIVWSPPFSLMCARWAHYMVRSIRFWAARSVSYGFLALPCVEYARERLQMIDLQWRFGIKCYK